MTRWIIFAGLTALIVTGYFATFYAHGKSFWRGVNAVPVELQKRTEETIAKAGAARWARVQIDGQVALLSGEAPTESDRDDLELAVRQAAGPGGPWWGGITQVRDAMTVAPARTPYFWSAKRGENGRVSLMGYVPGQSYYRDIKAEARKLFPTGVDDQLEIAGGHPTGPWRATAKAALKQLTYLVSGEAKFENKVLTLKGLARNSQEQAAAYAWAKALPRPYQGVAEVTLADTVAMPEMAAETPETTEPIVAAPVQRQAAADCQPMIARAMNANTVTFESTSSRLSAASQKRLDAIAKLGVECGTLQFRIRGHADRTPAETAIEYLSQDRALAVGQYLQDKGIGRDRIVASAMRASMPVSDADTPEAHARNRRAEVSILP